MEIKIHAGMRVLYKQDGQWEIGEVGVGNSSVTEKGLYIPILSRTSNNFYDKEINDVFFDTFKLEDWIKDYPKYFMTKEDYIKFIENEDFDKRNETAYVSDGEYGYYKVNKYTRNWLEKQPFDYIVRSD